MEPETETEIEQQEGHLYTFIRVWGKMLIVLAIWPIIFLVAFFGYLQFPILALVIIALGFLTWRWLATLPGELRSTFSGKRDRY